MLVWCVMCFTFWHCVYTHVIKTNKRYIFDVEFTV